MLHLRDLYPPAHKRSSPGQKVTGRDAIDSLTRKLIAEVVRQVAIVDEFRRAWAPERGRSRGPVESLEPIPK